MNAGKQASISGTAMPFHGTRRIVEHIATMAKRVASTPMFRSNWFCFIFSPMIRSDVVSNTKKAVETIKCSVKTVSGNTPIPISAKELKHRRYAPVLFDSVLISPSENTKARTPPSIMLELKSAAVVLSTPRSLKACCVHLNHGQCFSY